jgi:hypothetical protein
MAIDFRTRLFENINLKNTDELLSIWKKNDRVEWSDDAFIIIEEILRERTNELPPQGEPILFHKQEKIVRSVPGFEYLLNDVNPPEFYQPQEVLRLYDWINKAAKASVVILVLAGLFSLPQVQQTLLAYPMLGPNNGPLSWILAIGTTVIGVSLQSIITYFALRALASVLKILMEVELRSRGAVKKVS